MSSKTPSPRKKRMTRSSLERHRDAGKYKKWSDIAAFFPDPAAAATFLAQRRSQPKGTSVCRNTGEETFLYFDEEELSFETKKLDEVVLQVGADIDSATRLATLMTEQPHLFKKSGSRDFVSEEAATAAQPEKPDNKDAANKKDPPPKPKGKAKAKAKAKARHVMQQFVRYMCMD